jgi:acyl-lipid omega-6 desaturase (Delta-12 desaturase)
MPVEARRLAQLLSAYRRPNQPRSIAELAITALALVLLWTLAWFSFWMGHFWATPFVAIPAAGFLVRLFMIQHDCGHGAFFSRRLVNDCVGRAIGVLTLTPYGFWRRTHAIHHASSGNLDARGIGDIDTLTVSEFEALSRWEQLKYRVYRHPFVMLGVGPLYLFIFQHRLPVGLMGEGWRPWASTMGTNAGIAGMCALVVSLVGIKAFLLVQLPITLLASTAGVWLFFVQHQFEQTFWRHKESWSFHEAALYGSSHYDLPPLLRWLTANIGIHHVHHLCSGIPFYLLPNVLRDHPELREIGRVRLALWHEEEKRLISFRDISA